MHNAFLIGETIYLRPLEKADAPLAVRWFNDSEVIRTLRRYRPMTLLEEEEFLAGPARCEQPHGRKTLKGGRPCWRVFSSIDRSWHG